MTLSAASSTLFSILTRSGEGSPWQATERGAPNGPTHALHEEGRHVAHKPIGSGDAFPVRPLEVACNGAVDSEPIAAEESAQTTLRYDDHDQQYICSWGG